MSCDKDSSSDVQSFFKVMIGDDISEILFLPPKFAQTVSGLVDQKTYLEDLKGERWQVWLSTVNGLPAFQKGWRDFSLDHGLEVGDFVTFDYIAGSHFIVQLFGRCGCKKVDFSENYANRRKRKRTDGIFTSRKEPCPTSDNCSMSKQGSSTFLSGSANESQHHVNGVGKEPSGNGRVRLDSRSLDIEQTRCLIDRDHTNKGGEEMNILYDLSVFEGPWNTTGAAGNDKVLSEKGILPNNAGKSMISPTKAGSIHKDPVAEGTGRQIKPSDSSHIAMLPKISNSGHGHSSRYLPTRSAVKREQIANNSVDTPKIVKKESYNAEERRNRDSGNARVLKSHKQDTPVIKTSEQEVARLSIPFESPVSTAMQITGKDLKMAKEFGQTIGQAATNDFKVCKVVKTEPVEAVDFSSSDSDAITISCLMESNCRTFLVLPARLPSLSFRGMKMEGKIVFLRDPVTTRLWPVYYQEKHGLKVFASGWASFVKGNKIQQGDKCVFQLENAPECIYGVSIVRK